MKRASLKSIAAAAGVSKTTASFVLNGKGDFHKINAATQQRILTEARQQNYQPSFLAQTLSSGKTMSVGLLLPVTDNSFASTLTHQLVLHFQSQNYRLLPGIAQPSAVGEREVIDDFILRQVDAIIAIQPLHIKEWGSSLAALQIPLVVLHPQDGEIRPGYLNHNYTQMVNLLIQHHFQHHKKAIGFIGKERTSHPKLEAYLTCYIDRFDINSNYHYLLKEAEPLADAMKALVQENVNAIMFESPELAHQALQYIQRHHFSNIDNIGFSCIGWHPELTLAQPKVYGVDCHPARLAEQVGQMITAAFDPSKTVEKPASDTLYKLFP